MHYFIVDDKQKRFPDKKLEIGDQIVVNSSEIVGWFNAKYNIISPYSYRFRVASLKNVEFFVDENGLNERIC